MKRFLSVTVLAILVIALSGCASSMPGNAYGPNEVMQTMTVQYGTVDSVQPVTIQATPTGTGPLAGAVIGGAAGNSIGGGNGQIISTIGGAIIGGLVGAAAEKNAGTQNGQQITVQMDDGRLIAVVQGGTAQFARGQRVQVLTASDGTTRVAPAPPGSR
jgi:outer membrane lipoprotein SlyB